MIKYFDNFGNILQKLYTGHLNLLLRSRELQRCKRVLFEAKMTFWRSQLEKCICGILNKKCKITEIEDMTDTLQNFLSDNKLVHPDFLNFFNDFHKQFSVAYVQYINQIIQNINISPMQKLQLLVDEFLEMLNITLLELDGLNISCCLFHETENQCKISKQSCIQCKECEECKDSDNVVFLRVTPEYFQFEGVFDKLVQAFSLFKSPNKAILIVNYKHMCDRLMHYSWEEYKAYDRYMSVILYFHKIYFYKFQECVDFGKYQKEFEDNKQLIYNKHQLLKIIDAWRIEQGKKPKFTDIFITNNKQLKEQNKK